MKHTDSDKFAFLMIDFEMPEFIKELQKSIPEIELYKDENSENDYGLEKETHVTVVPCLDNDINLDDLKKLLKPLKEYNTILTDISLFKNDYDVLKCNASSMTLFETNKNILSKFKSHSEYKDYKPHVTIAYLKKGMGDKYVKDMLDKLIVLTPTNFTFSFYDKDGNFKKEQWK
jgi:2'-5' RNA ligase